MKLLSKKTFLGLILGLAAVLIITVLMLQTGQFPTKDRNSLQIATDAGIFTTYQNIRNLVILAYILVFAGGFIYGLISKSKNSSFKFGHFILSLLITVLLGVILIIFSFYLGLLLFELLGLVIGRIG